ARPPRRPIGLAHRRRRRDRRPGDGAGLGREPVVQLVLELLERPLHAGPDPRNRARGLPPGLDAHRKVGRAPPGRTAVARLRPPRRRLRPHPPPPAPRRRSGRL
ncbi:MAG: hypothetical protein AVDCRST_MAG08-1827, partial [uncultured Acetobacteraceae bacterium]